jgi:hypothetical protein
MATPKTTAEATRQAAAAAKLAETEGAVTEVLERQLKIKELLAAAEVKENEAVKESLRLQTEVLKNQAEVKQALKNEMDLRKALAEEEQQIGELRGAMSQFEIDQSFAKIEAMEAELDLIPGIIDGHNETIIQNKELISLIDEKTRAEKKFGTDYLKTLNDAEKAQTRVADALADFASGLPVIGGSLNKIFKLQSKAIKLGGALEKMGGATGELGKSITKYAKNLSFASIAIFAIVAAAAAMALQFDNLSKEIGRATGFGDKFALTLNKGYRQTMLSGVSMKEYAGAVTSLANNFSGFNPTAEKTNIYLANTTSRLEKLGVSADSSSKLMDHFHRAMGLSQKAAADMTAQLAMLGRQVGITASKMAADFQAASGRLAMYGKDTIKEFKALAVQAKATGLEVGSLLSISEKYDTFESAAEHAGKLNAVLGTQISTVAMLNMGEAERIKMIKEQVQASVGNFDSLDKHTKRYIALSMGVKDVAEAQKLLNMSQAETAANAAKMQEQADVQKELAAATAELVPMMQKLKLIGMKLFMVFSPFISFFTGLFELLDGAYEYLAPLIQGMGSAADAAVFLKLALIAIGLVLAVAFTPVTGVTAIILGVAAALGVWYDILHKPGSPSMAGGLFEHVGASIARFGEMILWPLKAVGMFADAISGLWGSAHSDEPNPIVAPEVDTSAVSGGFDIQALAEIDTSKVAAGINEIKSAVMELAGIKMDGFLAMHTDGSSSSFIMGSDGLIKSISEGKLIVDVKMPEMKLPEVLVKVFIGDRELKGIISTEVRAQIGAMG